MLASGASLGSTPWTDELPVFPARGQITRFALATGCRAPRRVVTGRHYAIPDGDTVYVGATFDRGITDAAPRASDDAANRTALAELLPDVTVRSRALSGHAGVRATTPDRMPLIGPVPDAGAGRHRHAELSRGLPPTRYPPPPCVPGLAVLGGFGSRGIVAAPFAASLLADWLCGGERLQPWAPLVHPARFAIRALRRR